MTAPSDDERMEEILESANDNEAAATAPQEPEHDVGLQDEVLVEEETSADQDVAPSALETGNTADATEGTKEPTSNPSLDTLTVEETSSPITSQQPTPLASASSSLHRTTTPTYLSPSDRVVDAWIQQSLTMPSSSGQRDESFRIDAGVPTTRHRRERSLGSGFTDYASIYGITTMSRATSAATTASSHTRETSLGFANADFQNSWSNHSAPATPANGDDSMNFSLPSALSTSLHGDGPLSISRVSSSTSPNREEELGGISSVIHDAARITDWRSVIHLCQTQPEAAAFIGRDGWTALHHACNRRCPVPEAVEALIRAYPDALLVEEDKGWLPLHYACRFKAPLEAVRLLLRMFPEKGRFGVSRPDRKGRTPLWYAVRYDAPHGVPSLLLEVDPSTVLEEDQNSETPLAIVWDQFAEKLEGRRTLSRIIGAAMEEGSGHQSFSDIDSSTSPASSSADPSEKAQAVRKRLETQTAWVNRWNRINLFLRAAFGFAMDDDWEMVDDSEEKKDSPGSQPALYPEQVYEIDCNDLKRMDRVSENNDDAEMPKDLTALHLAASSRAHGVDGRLVLARLLEMNAAAARCVDSGGSTPLHRIAGNPKKDDWIRDGIRELYNANVEAVRLTDSNGRLPLHRAACAITYQTHMDAESLAAQSKICQLLELNEDGAHHTDHFGCLPLHLVAQNGKGWDAQVQALYDANPEAVRMRTGVKYGNRLALHLAAANPNAELSLVSKLVELNPRGAAQADRKGMYPLHIACETGLDWRCIRAIHEAYPDAVQQVEQNSRGWTALHMAASSKTTETTLIANVLELNPEAASIADSKGDYPLHLACRNGSNWESGLSELFDANADAISSPDSKGLLPLHILSFMYCRENIIKPTGPQVIDIRGRRLSRSAALLEAEQATANEAEEARKLGNLFSLIKADPTVLPRVDG